MPAQMYCENECWPPDIIAVLPKVLPALHNITFEVLCKSMLEKDSANNAGEESRSSDVGAHRKWQPLPCPSVSHGVLSAIRQSSCRLLGGICEWFICYRVGS